MAIFVAPADLRVLNRNVREAQVEFMTRFMDRELAHEAS